MAMDIIVAVQLDNQGRPTTFEISSVAGHDLSPTGSRYESAAWVAKEVKLGAKIDTMIGNVLVGYLTVITGASGLPVFGIDDRMGIAHRIEDLRRLS
ncbi:hypothetical protein ACIQSO_22250 [Pseudomonas putida]|uniref:hypothetical protein n=1 Tax=Pseudomonas putida TaxID=303 RepID=UPI00383B5213